MNRLTNRLREQIHRGGEWPGLTLDEAMIITPADLRPIKSKLGIDLSLPSVIVGDDDHFVFGTQVILQADNDGRIDTVSISLPHDMRPELEPIIAKKGPMFHIDADGSALMVREYRGEP